MSKIDFQQCIETLDNLNRSQQSMKGTTYTPGERDGTYSLINKMISDLASIKRSLKQEESKIRRDVSLKIYENATTAASITMEDLELSVPADTSLQTSRATLTTNAGSGYPANDTSGTTFANLKRYEKQPSTGSTDKAMPAILVGKNKTGLNIKYDELVVFGVLSNAANVINSLRSFNLAAGAVTGTAVTLADITA
jgi:hypothetical protein